MDKRIVKKAQIYYAKIMPTIGIYDLLELKVRTVEDTWFVAVENKSKAYMFNESDINKIVFFDRKEALGVVKEAEAHKKVVSDETYYEEY